MYFQSFRAKFDACINSFLLFERNVLWDYIMDLRFCNLLLLGCIRDSRLRGTRLFSSIVFIFFQYACRKVKIMGFLPVQAGSH